MTEPAPGPSPAEVYERAFVSAIFARLTKVVVPRAAVARGDRVLDLACGTGVVARAVAPIVGPEGRVVAVDLRPGMIAVAQSHEPTDGARIEWQVGDATAMDLPDASFDVVICQQGLQFFEDRGAAAQEVHRVLRPGGRFVAAVWRGIEHQPLMQALTELERPYLGPLGVTEEDQVIPFSFGQEAAVRGLLASAGFVDIDITTANMDTAFAANTFIRDVEFAYAGFVPAFLEDAEAYARFVASVENDAGPGLERFRRGGEMRAPMSTHVVVAAR